MPYSLQWTPEFFDSISKGEAAQYAEKALELAERLLEDPYRVAHSHNLHGDLLGKRAANLTDKLRIIFTICEECRRDGHGERNCANCCSNPDADPKTLIFWEVIDYH